MSIAHHIGIWCRAVRPFSLSASVVPVVVGTALAAYEGVHSPLLFSLALLGSLFIQVGANLTDEYFDHVRGHGGLKFPAPHKVIERRLLSPALVLRGARLFIGLGSAIGLFLAVMVGWPLVVVGVASVLAAYFHSAGPKPLGSVGWGEITVFIFMGPVMVGASYYVQTGMVSAEALGLSLPVGFLVAAILLANNIRDVEEDRAWGKVTLATLMGRRGAKSLYTVLVLGSFMVVGGLVGWGLAPLGATAAFLSLPRALQLSWLLTRAGELSHLDRLLRGTAGLHLGFGLLLGAGLLVSRLI